MKIAYEQKLIENIWESVFLKKYLGTRRMKKVFEILLEKCNLSYEPTKGVPLKYQETYKKYRNNEWFLFKNCELYKSSGGTFHMTIYHYDDLGRRYDDYLYVYDLNLRLSYATVDQEASLVYEKKYQPLFEESYRHYENLFKKS